MKLGYVCQYFTRKYRGPVTNLLFELSKDLDVVNYSFRGKHMQYHAGGVHAQKTEKVNEHLTLRRYDVRFRVGGLLFPQDLDNLLSADRPDLIQSEEYYQPASHIAFKHARRSNIPFILNHRGSVVRDRTLSERLFFSVANPWSKTVVDGAKAVICLSEAGKSVLFSVFPQAEPKVHVIPNSIDPKAYGGADGRSFRSEYGIPDSSPLLLCVARLHPQKRIDLLVRAFAQVKGNTPEAVLCVVGPWSDREKARVDSIVSELRLDDVVFTGPVPNEEVKDAYAAADVVALTSEYEPFGYCLLEAMAQSKPLVAFDIGAVSEIIAEGESGFIVPFADTNALAQKVVTLFEDKSLSAKMGANGLGRIKKKFLLKDNSRRLISLYEELVA